MAGSIIAAVVVGVLVFPGIAAGYWGFRQWTSSASRLVRSAAGAASGRVARGRLD
jgi:hypothetical protein